MGLQTKNTNLLNNKFALSEKFLIYIDILGYDKRAQMGDDIGIAEARKIREDFYKTIQNKINEIKFKFPIVGISPGRDDWILVIDSKEIIDPCDICFKIISEILDHNTGYKGDFKTVKLEIGLGTAKFDKWAKFGGEKLIREQSTINFLKTKLINYYHRWFENNYHSPIMSSFVILTESFYKKINFVDKEKCKLIKYTSDKTKAEEIISFYHVDINSVDMIRSILEFLEKIKYKGNIWYRQLNWLFVFPLQFNEITKKLSKERIIFITGTPEYGKTFVAVFLLWEFFLKGYEPIWFKIKVGEKLENISANIKPGQIIYFEDPFGYIEYKRRKDLERQIGDIINIIKNLESVYVIITSRKEVFTKFEKEKLSEISINIFESTLNIGRPSYDYNKRIEMLLKYAKMMNCKWYSNEVLRKTIIFDIRDENILPSPLSIRSFALETRNINDLNEIKRILKIKSKETAKSFAKEIKFMEKEKILFFSLLFLTVDIKTKLLKNIYESLILDFNLEGVLKFEEIVEWFRDDKIDTDYFGNIRFYHSSYLEALKYLLYEDKIFICKNEKFLLKIFNYLAENNDTAVYIAESLKDNFDIILESFRNKLILKLTIQEKATKYLTDIVLENYNKILPVKIKNFQFLIPESSKKARIVAEILIEKFELLPHQIRNTLLSKLSNYDNVSDEIIKILTTKFDLISKKIRNFLLLNLLKSEIYAEDIARLVLYKFNLIPSTISINILETLSIKIKPAYYVSCTMMKNYNSLPKNIKDLLFDLSKKEDFDIYVSLALENNYLELPKEIRNRLLQILSKNEDLASIILKIINKFFKVVPNKFKSNFIIKNLYNDETAYYIAEILMNHFNYMSNDFRNFLSFNLLKLDLPYESLSYTLIENFFKFPDSIKERIIEFFENKNEKDYLYFRKVLY